MADNVPGARLSQLSVAGLSVEASNLPARLPPPHAGSRGSMEVVPVVVAQNIGISFHIRAWKVCTLNNATG